jgi:hypothetical protein
MKRLQRPIKTCVRLQDCLLQYTQLPYLSGHMETFPDETKERSVRRDRQPASMKHIHNTQTSLSEPEDGMSSEVESFDEEEMYPANYNDESVSDSLDLHSDGESQSPVRGPVCASLYITYTSPDV